MKVLGLLASFRSNGNSEILLKEALMGAREAGSEVDLLRLTDLRIDPCQGYGLCLFREEGCHIQDDVKLIWSKMEESDGVILSTPCYFLEATAVVKQLIDRAWFMAHRGLLRGRYASIIVPYATRGWIPYAMLQPNILFGILGFHVIHREAFNVQGVAEAALEDAAIEKAHRIGRELVSAINQQDAAYRSAPGLCPICQDWNIRILKDRRSVECPTCGVRGELSIQNGRIEVNFPEEALREYRFSPEVGYNHFTYHIKPSRDFYLRTKEERKRRMERYKGFLEGGGSNG